MKQRGMSLIELLTVLAILGLGLAIVTANFGDLRRREGLRGLGQQILMDAQRCRMAALVLGRNVGLVFSRQNDRWYYEMVEDQDRDGVSRRDLLAGVDRPMGPRTWLEFLSAGARLGVPPWAVPDPSGRGTLGPDGLRIGGADILAFSPRARSTPCTVYFNDGHERMLAVRLSGSSGRIRLLEWRRGWSAWRDLAVEPR